MAREATLTACTLGRAEPPAAAAPRTDRGCVMSKEHLKVKARRLISAANELLAIARELEANDIDGQPIENARNLPVKDSPIWAEHAKAHYRDRRRRATVFADPTLFGEPAWDILLDLFIAAKERKRLPVTSACIGSAVPATTALRWLTVLEEKGLIVRENDANDARRVFVRLSTDGYEKMVAYFSETATEGRIEEEHEATSYRLAQ